MGADSTPHRLTAQQARRIAVRAQLLDAAARRRDLDVLEVVQHLTMLQVDLTARVAPSAELVLWSRLGGDLDPAEPADLQEQQRLVEVSARLLHHEDVALHRAEMAVWPDPDLHRAGEHESWAWVLDNGACRADVLERLRADGPLPASALPDTCVRPWGSSGWNDDRNIGRMLELLSRRGEVAVAAREGRVRLWDLAERVFPDDPLPPVEEALHERGVRRLRALGLARATAALMPGAEPSDVGMVGEPAVVEGVRGAWRVDPEQLAAIGVPFEGRVALLSPLDRLVFDRKRMVELFDFDYQLEMYKPAASRRWGYYALPVLVGDRLLGKVDATADRRAGALVVHALHEDEPFDDATTDAVRAEVADLAGRLGLEVVWAR
ncbi:hypothetical protein I601_2111 [Nocardioides dokdonensis FR1436]|uniref:Winged helix DNA-binding domain-containing protein n=1 Tax=Nocardioides dokdonensis FR1436 TaxID=1300347 RepID=A0A1A9GKC8_9ACTN|nr:crosslink repair DNA glycosylase YcaQ family protein [Nocardioides dokdonensis]ANH38536.1 hypothetical protein I601_2111 [Nocardioides dokdonensis FR1436]